MNKRVINQEDYPMVLDWSGYKTTQTKLSCKCQDCDNIVYKSISKIDGRGFPLCKECGKKKKGKRREVIEEDYPMVLDWSGYKTTQTKLPCKCQGCGVVIFKSISKIDTHNKTCYCHKCGCNIKLKQTNLERHGVENAMQSEEIKNRVKKSNIKRFGVENPFQYPEIKEKIKRLNIEKHGVPYHCMVDKCRSTSKTISNINLKWYNLIKEKLNIECEKEFSIQNQSYDLKIDNLLIEINPTFSHNSTFSYAFASGKSKNNNPFPTDYHFNKWKLAKDNGYTLISIFDNMNENKILSVIRSKLGLNETKIPARKCKIKEISQKEINIFLERYHVQGKTSGQKVCVGLFYENELIGIMTFGTPRFNKNYEWELIRLCFKENMTIQGGISKMWSYFKEAYNPTNCICYLNLNLGGDTMVGTDFVFKQYNKPAGYWEHIKTGQIVSNNSLRFKGASRFIGDDNFTKYHKGMNNREIMILEGFVEMYDCGNVVYEYKKR